MFMDTKKKIIMGSVIFILLISALLIFTPFIERFKLQEDMKDNSYEQELMFKGDNPTSVSASGGNLNISVYPEVSKVFQTSNGLSYARHDIQICNTQNNIIVKKKYKRFL